MERRPPFDRGRSGPGPRRPQHQIGAPLQQTSPFGPPPKPELIPPPPKPERKPDPIAKPGTSHVQEEVERLDAERTKMRASRAQVVPVPRKKRGKPAVEPPCAPTEVCRILFADEHLVVVDKSGGFPVTPTGAFHKRSVLMALRAQGIETAFPINLLDAEASGLVLLSRTAEAAQALRWNWRSKLCVRTYIAIVQGDIQGIKGRISHAIGAVSSSGGMRHRTLAVEEGGRAAVTDWKLQARSRGMSRLELNVKSSRCHQVRIHLAAIGHPVIGDRIHGRNVGEVPLEALVELPSKYQEGPVFPNGQIALHFFRVSMPHPVTQQEVRWQAPLPRAMTALMPGVWVMED